MKKLLTLILLATVLIVSAGTATKAPKYVFLFIGDGMASPQRMVADEFARHAGHDRLVINQMPFHGTTRTGSTDSLVTDSAASGTAIACGEKTYNGAIGIAADGKRKLVSSADIAKSTGKKVGIVTTVAINNATPAAFYAHRTSRSQLYEIGLDLINSNFDYFAGSGWDGAENNTKSKEYKGNLDALAKEAGFSVITKESDFKALKPGSGKILIHTPAIFAIDHPKNYDFTLANLTAKGIELLDNKDGFFMMVEGGRIDHAGHANDAAPNLREVLAFDDAVRVAIEFAKKHADETLIVVTGDHETGGMTMGFAATGYAMYMERLAFQKCSTAMLKEIIKEEREYKLEMENMNLNYEDITQILSNYYGFVFDEESKSPMKLSSSQKAKIKDAYKSSSLPDTARRIMAEKAGIGWSTGAHTALPVLTTATGKCAEKFTGFYENSDISIRLKEILK